ncbi:unnamed protein product [Rhodiola kirilowii]
MGSQLLLQTLFRRSKKQKLESPKMAENSIKYFVVDAFTDAAFKGNPAAVCLLNENKTDEYLQSLAKEFNLSETCYLTPLTDCHIASSFNDSSVPRFLLRWFTPVTEVKLCGHATLASAHVLFTNSLVDGDVVEFLTLSGVLTATKLSSDSNGQFYIELNFPVAQTVKYDSVDDPSLVKAFSDATVVDVHITTTSEDLLVELPSGIDVVDFQPHFDVIEKCPGKAGVIVTGAAPPDSGFDIFSRYFCPKFGIPEDPVTGSVHCALAAYWSKKLGKPNLIAYQASPRGGKLELRLDEEQQRVKLRGKAVTVMEGSILV